MRQEISDLKSNFQNWLESNLSTITPKNRRSTSYDYMRRIERICDKFFQGHNNACFSLLMNNIVPILSLYAEYENMGHYFYHQKTTLGRYHNENPLTQYFEGLNKNFKGSWNILDSEFVDMSVIVKEEELPISKISFSSILCYLQIFEVVSTFFKDSVEKIQALLKSQDSFIKIDGNITDFIKKLKQILTISGISSTSECILHIKYAVDSENQKNKIALKRFYDYLCVNHLKRQNFTFLLENIEGQSSIEGKIEEIVPMTGKSARQVFVGNRRLLNQNETADILECHSNSLKKLVEKDLIQAEIEHGKEKYSVKSINAYLKKHHHQANPQYDKVDYTQKGKNMWCTCGEAATILGCSSHTILDYARKQKLTYTNNVPQLSKYYVPELEYLKSVLKFNIRYKSLRKQKNIKN